MNFSTLWITPAASAITQSATSATMVTAIPQM